MVSESSQKSDSLKNKIKMSEFGVSESLRNEQNPVQMLPNGDESFSEYTELLTKFLSSVMIKNYQMALNYCTQILKNDPSNTTAQEFYHLLIKKLEMDLDESSSESSDKYSSSSSRSSDTSTSEQSDAAENLENKSTLFAKKNNPSFEKNNKNVKDGGDSNVKRTKTNSRTGNPETMKFNPMLESVKRSQNQTQLPLKLETQLQQNRAIKKNIILAKGVKQPKQEKHKDLDKSGIALQEQASKILLHPTKTTILSKEISPPKFSTQ